MKFEYSDAWLLEAIKLSENGDEGASLTDIVQTADYINHAILTYKEFTTGTKKLKSIGLITEKNKRLQTTEVFKEWWTKKYAGKSGIYILKALEEIEKYLDKTYGTGANQMTETATEFTETDFDKSTKEYLDMASEIIKKLTTKKKTIKKKR
jgi:hypothetical protein